MNYKLLAALTVAAAGVPGVACAATVSMEPTGAVFHAAAGEANNLVLGGSSNPYTFSDAGAPLTAGDGCAAGPPVTCPAGPAAAYLGDRADTATFNSFLDDTTLDAGPGDDDVLVGGVSATAFGGSGDDTIRLAANDTATADGGPGADAIAGGGGEVRDVLDGDGGADLLVLTGTPSASTADGGDGPDRIVVQRGGFAASTADGGAGADILVGPADGRRVTLDGGPGLDRIQSRAGGATIDAGAGPDLVDAAHGGAPDTVACGPGFDVVFADPDDTVAPDCEWRFNTAAPTGLGFETAVADAAALVAHRPGVPTAAAARAVRRRGGR